MSPFISETVRDRRIVTTEYQQKVSGNRTIRTGSNDLKWPWKARWEGSDFSGGSL